MTLPRTARRTSFFAFALAATLALPGKAQQAALSTLQDTLGGTSIAPVWTVSTQASGTVTEGGGTLNLAPIANSGTAQLIVRSAVPYTLVGSSGFVQAAQVVSGGGSVNSRFELYLNGSNTIEWMFESGSLSAIYTVNGVTKTAISLPYDASISWWRIREASGSVYWDTAPDGLNWRNRASVLDTSLFALSSLYPEFYVETWGAGSSSPGTARYGNFNTVPVRQPVESLVDSFAGTSVSPSLWAVVAKNGQVTESAGTLKLAPNTNTGAAQLYVRSSSLYTLLGSNSWVKVPAVVSAGGSVNNRFTLLADSGNYLQWYFEAGTLYAFSALGGVRTTVASLPYSATTHACWRIRETSGTVFWETSPDGLSWTTQGSALTATLLKLGGVHLEFYAETFGAGLAAPGIAQYARLSDNPRIVVSGIPATVTAGTSVAVTFDVRDSAGARVSGYRGTVSFQSSDSRALLPASHVFTSADAGLYTGVVTFRTTGTQSVFAVDGTTASINGSQSGISVLAAPVTPVITASSPVTSGFGGWSASVPATPGMSYYWTVSGGSITSTGGAAGVTSTNLNTITYSAAAAAPGTITLTCAESNAAGASSLAGSQAVDVVTAPATPVVSAPSPVTTGAVSVTASTAAHTGMIYAWSVNGGTITSAGGSAGQVVGGVNSIAYIITAGAGATTTVSCVESNAAGTSSATGTVAETVVAQPITPVVSAPSATTVAITGLTASVPARAGMTYGWSVSGAGSLTSPAAGTTSAAVNQISFAASSTPGTISLSCSEVNAAGTSSAAGTASVTVNQQTQPPSWPAGSALSSSNGTMSGVTLTWTAAADPVAVTQYRVYQEGALVTTLSSSVRTLSITSLKAGNAYHFAVQAGNGAALWTGDGPTLLYYAVPPDPQLVAPPLDRTVVVSFADSTSFLYTGTNPIQTGVAAGTIKANQAAVIRHGPSAEWRPVAGDGNHRPGPRGAGTDLFPGRWGLRPGGQRRRAVDRGLHSRWVLACPAQPTAALARLCLRRRRHPRPPGQPGQHGRHDQHGRRASDSRVRLH